MIAGGVPFFIENHSEKVLNTSIGMMMESKLVLNPITQEPIQIRIGIHSGPVTAGVVGIKMPRFFFYKIIKNTFYLKKKTINIF